MLRRILPPIGTVALLAPLYIFIIDPYPMPEEVLGISRDLWLLTGFAAVFLWVTAFSFAASGAAPSARAATPKEKSKSKPTPLPPSPPAKILSEAAWSADTDQVAQTKAKAAGKTPTAPVEALVLPAPAEPPPPAPAAAAPAGSLQSSAFNLQPAQDRRTSEPPSEPKAEDQRPETPLPVPAASPFDAPGMTMMMPSIIPSPAIAAPRAPAPVVPTAPLPPQASPVVSFASAAPSSDLLPQPARPLPPIDDAAGRTLLGLKLEDIGQVKPPEPSRSAPPLRPPSAAAAPSTVNDYEALYRDFVRLRAENGEPPAPPREKFIDSLTSRRESIRRDSGVDDVRFEVYSKAGRATLRATPIRHPR